MLPVEVTNYINTALTMESFEDCATTFSINDAIWKVIIGSKQDTPFVISIRIQKKYIKK